MTMPSRRLLLTAIILSVVLGFGATFISYDRTQAKSNEQQIAAARSYYLSHFADMDQYLEMASASQRTAIELLKLLDDDDPVHNRLTAYLAVLGSVIPFEDVVVTDVSGRILYRFRGESAGLAAQPATPRGWQFADGTLYRTFCLPTTGPQRARRDICFFARIGSGALSNISYPGTVAAIYWQGELVGRSESFGATPAAVQTTFTLPDGGPDLLIKGDFTSPLSLLAATEFILGGCISVATVVMLIMLNLIWIGERRAGREREQLIAEMRIRDAALASSSMPMVLANLDETIRYANGAFAGLYGSASPADVLGAPLHSFLEHAEQAAQIVTEVRQNRAWDGEARYRRKDGSIVEVHAAANLVQGEAGEPICFFVSFVDLTEWKRLDAERRLWADAFEHASIGIGVTEAATGRQIAVNPAYAAMHGLRAEDMIGHPLRTFYPAEEAAIHRDAIAACDSKGSVEYDSTRIRANGERFPIRMWASTVYDGAGQPRYRIGTVIDMTERLELEHRLQQAQKMEAIGNLTGGIAHDFNNLLGVVVLSLDSLAVHLNTNPEAAALADEALMGALKGAELTRQLLAFARRQELRPAHLPLNDVVREIMTLARRVLGDTITVSMELGDTIWPVLADRGQLESSLLNLALNARDAMPIGGQLTITTANVQVDAAMAITHPELTVGEYATISVSDTGTGMTPEVKARIFEPFFTTKAPGHGTGLGLSAVFGFLRQSKGLVTVYSEPGHGTMFRLYLPRATGELVAETAPAHQGAPAQSRGEQILVVEDNALFRTTLVHQLLALGYRVLEATDSQSALDTLSSGDIQLVLSDVIMAGNMDGIDLAYEMASRWPALPVILMSGFTEERFNGKGNALPATVRFLKKPFRLDELARALREAISPEGFADD